MEKIIESNKEQDTYDLGYELGQHAKPGQVFTLVGDLGVGKTVFTKGLAAGLGITEPVSSPTFTIVQVYEEGRLPFYHFDVYRIGDIEEMEEIGYDDYFFGNGVCMIEWAELIEELIPENSIPSKDHTHSMDYNATIRKNSIWRQLRSIWGILILMCQAFTPCAKP